MCTLPPTRPRKRQLTSEPTTSQNNTTQRSPAVAGAPPRGAAAGIAGAARGGGGGGELKPVDAVLLAARGGVVKPPPGLYANAVELGAKKAAGKPVDTLLLGIVSGFHIGFGGLLAITVGGSIPAIKVWSVGEGYAVSAGQARCCCCCCCCC